MPPATAQEMDHGRLVDEFAGRVPGVAHAMVVSAEGLRIAVSHRLPIERADQLAAAASGVLSLTNGAARAFHAGVVKETVVSMDRGVLIAMPVEHDGASLVVLAAPNCDMGHIAFEMSRLAAILARTIVTDHGPFPASIPAPAPAPPAPPTPVGAAVSRDDGEPHTVPFERIR